MGIVRRSPHPEHTHHMLTCVAKLRLSGTNNGLGNGGDDASLTFSGVTIGLIPILHAHRVVVRALGSVARPRGLACSFFTLSRTTTLAIGSLRFQHLFQRWL